MEWLKLSRLCNLFFFLLVDIILVLILVEFRIMCFKML